MQPPVKLGAGNVACCCDDCDTRALPSVGVMAPQRIALREYQPILKGEQRARRCQIQFLYKSRAQLKGATVSRLEVYEAAGVALRNSVWLRNIVRASTPVVSPNAVHVADLFPKT